MKKFLAVYMGSTSPSIMEKWNAMPEAERKQKQMSGIEAWKSWVEKNVKSIQEHGNPLGKTKRIDKSGVSDTKNLMTGFTVVEAENHEAAANMFLNHPHFTIFPGESIEIMECLPIPGM